MASESPELRLLLDEQAILRTLHRYCHAMDYGLQAEWLDLFTVDGIFDVYHPSGQTIHRENGREALARYVASYPHPPAAYPKHLVLSPIIDIDGDTARVQSYFVLLVRGKHGDARVGSYGRYTDRLQKIDGQWRFAERLAEVEARDPKRN